MKWACLAAMLSVLSCDDASDEALPVVEEARHAAFLPNAECAPCHPRQAAEYAASTMHYATFSPVFNAFEIALGEIHGPPVAGDVICRGCHAPVGEREGLITDDSRHLRDALPSLADQGISCDFCHRVEAIGGISNAALEASPGATKLGPFADPVANAFHHSADASERISSAAFCGACHDVRLPLPDVVAGEEVARLENLFTEWRDSPWAQADHVQNPLRGQPGIAGVHDEARLARGEQVTCQDCHMSLYPERRINQAVDAAAFAGVDPATLTRKAHKLYPAGQAAVAAEDEVPIRRVSTHAFAGASTPLVPFPPAEPRNEESLERRTAMLRAAVTLDLGETPAQAEREGALEVRAWLENVGAGHNVPAGFSQEREVWVELTVVDEGRACVEDADCSGLVEPRRFPDNRPLQCEIDDPVVTTEDGRTRDARARAERSAVCDRVRGACVLYRSGYLLDRDGDGRVEDEDLRHELVDLDPETLDERCVLGGPDADQRPQGIDQGLVWFTNQFQAVTVVDGAADVHPQAMALEPSAAPYVPPPDAPPVLDQPSAERRSEHATQRALQARVKYRSAHLGRPPAVADPLRANRFFNDHALRPFEPRLARYLVVLPEGATGPVRITARLRMRFFPPRLLRALTVREAARGTNLVTEAMVDAHLSIVDMAEAETTVELLDPAE